MSPAADIQALETRARNLRKIILQMITNAGAEPGPFTPSSLKGRFGS